MLAINKIIMDFFLFFLLNYVVNLTILIVFLFESVIQMVCGERPMCDNIAKNIYILYLNAIISGYKLMIYSM